MPQVLEWKKDNMLGILKLEISTITAERFSSFVGTAAVKGHAIAGVLHAK